MYTNTSKINSKTKLLSRPRSMMTTKPSAKWWSKSPNPHPFPSMMMEMSLQNLSMPMVRFHRPSPMKLQRRKRSPSLLQQARAPRSNLSQSPSISIATVTCWKKCTAKHLIALKRWINWENNSRKTTRNSTRSKEISNKNVLKWCNQLRIQTLKYLSQIESKFSFKVSKDWAYACQIEN